jgi:hypothetical protein
MNIVINDFSLFGNEKYQTEIIQELKDLASKHIVTLKMSSSTYLATTLYKLDLNLRLHFEIVQGYETNKNFTEAQVVLNIWARDEEA